MKRPTRGESRSNVWKCERVFLYITNLIEVSKFAYYSSATDKTLISLLFSTQCAYFIVLDDLDNYFYRYRFMHIDSDDSERKPIQSCMLLSLSIEEKFVARMIIS